MLINDNGIYDHILFNIKWYKEYMDNKTKELNEHQTSSPGLVETDKHMIAWANGKIDAYKDMLSELDRTRKWEVEKIEKEMKKYEDNEQVQSA